MSDAACSDPLRELIAELGRAGFEIARDQDGLAVVASGTPWRVWRSRRDDGTPGACYVTRPAIPWRTPRTLVAETAAELRQALKALDG